MIRKTTFDQSIKLEMIKQTSLKNKNNVYTLSKTIIILFTTMMHHFLAHMFMQRLRKNYIQFIQGEV